jgi:hypothetical protein
MCCSEKRAGEEKAGPGKELWPEAERYLREASELEAKAL